MGISPIHHENFDWSQMTEDKPNLLGDRFAEKVGDVWYKRGAGWGESENQRADTLQPLRRHHRAIRARRNSRLASLRQMVEQTARCRDV